jgi:hypothetical protein
VKVFADFATKPDFLHQITIGVSSLQALKDRILFGRSLIKKRFTERYNFQEGNKASILIHSNGE